PVRPTALPTGGSSMPVIVSATSRAGPCSARPTLAWRVLALTKASTFTRSVGACAISSAILTARSPLSPTSLPQNRSTPSKDRAYPFEAPGCLPGAFVFVRPAGCSRRSRLCNPAGLYLPSASGSCQFALPAMIRKEEMSFAKLDELGRKLEALEHALAILGADEATHMAPGGGEKRAETLALLSGMYHRQ